MRYMYAEEPKEIRAMELKARCGTDWCESWERGSWDQLERCEIGRRGDIRHW